MQVLRKVLVKLLKETADKVASDTCEMTESEAMELMTILSHEAMSKEKACSYLNISRSRFDELVREGKLPKGRRRTGHKELDWYKDELDVCVRKIKKGNNN